MIIPIVFNHIGNGLSGKKNNGVLITISIILNGSKIICNKTTNIYNNKLVMSPLFKKVAKELTQSAPPEYPIIEYVCIIPNTIIILTKELVFKEPMNVKNKVAIITNKTTQNIFNSIVQSM